MRLTTNQDGIRTYSKDEELVDSKRNDIVENATHVFVKRGYHEVNMRELAETCNMSVGSIYRYIGTKQDILYLIIHKSVTRPDTFFEDLDKSAQQLGPVETLKGFIRAYYTSVDKEHTNTAFTYQETKSLDPESQRTIMEAAARDIDACALILKRGVDSGVFKIDNIHLIAHTVIVAGHMWAVRWWYLRKICTLDEYITEHTNMILNMIMPAEYKGENCHAK